MWQGDLRRAESFHPASFFIAERCIFHLHDHCKYSMHDLKIKGNKSEFQLYLMGEFLDVST